MNGFSVKTNISPGNESYLKYISIASYTIVDTLQLVTSGSQYSGKRLLV